MAEKNNRKKSVIIAAVFLAVLFAAGAAALILNRKETAAGGKAFTLELISERDAYRGNTEYSSDAETLGDFLRTLDFVEYEDSTYGIYVKGFYDMKEDMDNQYWWCLSVDGEDSKTGADEVPLSDGSVYTFTLKQGW